MPKNTKVDKMYEAIKKKTGDKGKAARIAQAKTGLSLKTGKKPKKKGTALERFVASRTVKKKVDKKKLEGYKF